VPQLNSRVLKAQGLTLWVAHMVACYHTPFLLIAVAGKQKGNLLGLAAEVGLGLAGNPQKELLFNAHNQ
tara:strand:- start:2203 stop:2409 length:207 start_codon:yes stop_codon:yes gene_type:complete